MEFILALKQRDRVRRIRFWLLDTNLPNFIEAMDDEYAILEDPIIMHHTKASTIFPEPVQAPHLHHFTLIGFAPSDKVFIAHDCCGSCLCSWWKPHESLQV